MKFQISAALIGLAATSVAAQYNQTGPFALTIKGTNPGSTIDGIAYSCHTGAALEGICYQDSPPAELTNSYTYYFNYTGYTEVDGQDVGLLVWNQQFTGQDGNPTFGSQSLELLYQPISNVAATQISYQSGGFLVGFDASNKLFGYSYVDDSTFLAGQQPTELEGKAYYQWVVCWQYYTGYYYQSLGWVVKGAPSNPTCEPVDITKALVADI